MHSNFAPNSSSSRDKDKKQTERGENNLALFVFFPLCHWHGGFEDYRSGSEMIELAQ